MSALEIWGGVECTVNRVGDTYRDQVRDTGHHDRDDDLTRLAELGVTAVRYPVLWERVCHRGVDEFDWRWSDRRLGLLRELGIRPIVGLIHHGSGPPHTSLVSDDFATGAARFAAAVVRRYPWVEEWTPVNEPLTTARFSALYGLWYPHLRDERMFWLALLNQVEAVRLAMAAIRREIPSAGLIQTEDLGRTYATAPLADQAAFDNSRRWMTWDLLFGRVVPGHALWDRLAGFGLADRLRVIADDPCPPTTLGINHYLTSDRFLDHRVGRYPPGRAGSNGREIYADVEAVRALDPPPAGFAGAMHEAWVRYRTPIALTEVHNGCSREEQVRWLRDAWTSAQEAKAKGVDVRALTSWALFGSCGWDTLLTGDGGYEPGAFDVRGEPPRPTAIAHVLGALPRTSEVAPGSAGPGWWRREARYAHPRVARPAKRDALLRSSLDPRGRPLLIVGGTGTLGRAMARACEQRGIAYRTTSRSELDLLDPLSMELALERHAPWAVVNCGGWVRVDEAEDEPNACLAVNGNGAAALARACAARDIASMTFSTDLVFDGRKRTAYVESDQPDPRNVYGRSKARMERAVLALPGRHLIVRTAAFFSPHDRANFAVHVADRLSTGQACEAAEDYFVTPTYVPDLCEGALDLVLDGEAGIWHLSNEEELSWHAFGVRIAEALALDPRLMEPVGGKHMAWKAPRPRRSALVSARGKLLPSLQSAIDRFSAVSRA